MLARSVWSCDCILRLLTERSWHVLEAADPEFGDEGDMGQGPRDVIDWAEGRTG